MIESINKITKAIRLVMARNVRYKTTMQQLSSLSSRELADIGISRCDIPRIAREHAEALHV